MGPGHKQRPDEQELAGWVIQEDACAGAPQQGRSGIVQRKLAWVECTIGALLHACCIVGAHGTWHGTLACHPLLKVSSCARSARR